VSTLTFVYSDSTAVLGPLATYAEPHSYDLCLPHAGRLSVPRGWEVVRLPMHGAEAPGDDLLALADAVREAVPSAPPPEPVVTGRRGHLRVLRSPEQPTTAPPPSAPTRPPEADPSP
jgi:hypothetical protein